MSTENSSKGNGNGAARTEDTPHVTITITDPITFGVSVTGAFPSLDYALNMLAQATRELEAQWRLARASLYQQQQLALQQEAQIRADLRRRH